MTKELKDRIKSLIWRALGIAFIAGAAYFLGVGDLWAIDVKTLVNVSSVAFVGLVFNEVTKYLNKG